MWAIGALQRVGHRMRDFGAVFFPFGIARQNNVASAIQQAGQAVKGLAPHNHGPAFGYLFEMPQVCGEMPRHAAIFPDDSIGGAGEDKDDFGMIHNPALP
jgi:hypothetical protein